MRTANATAAISELEHSRKASRLVARVPTSHSSVDLGEGIGVVYHVAVSRYTAFEL
jgi:hypothetical protein